MLGTLFLFVVIVGLVIVVGIAVGMITATRIDRIMNPAHQPRDPDPEPPKEQQP